MKPKLPWHGVPQVQETLREHILSLPGTLSALHKRPGVQSMVGSATRRTFEVSAIKGRLERHRVVPSIPPEPSHDHVIVIGIPLGVRRLWMKP